MCYLCYHYQIIRTDICSSTAHTKPMNYELRNTLMRLLLWNQEYLVKLQLITNVLVCPMHDFCPLPFRKAKNISRKNLILLRILLTCPEFITTLKVLKFNLWKFKAEIVSWNKNYCSALSLGFGIKRQQNLNCQ